MNQLPTESSLWSERDGDIMPFDMEVPVDEGLLSRDDFEYNVDNADDIEFRLHGISVDLADRALALVWIMGYFNRANRSKGLSHAAVTPARAKLLRQRYREATPDVVHDAHQSVLADRAMFDRELDILVGGPSLRKSGMSEDDIALKRTRMQIELNETYGTGQDYANDRRKLTRTVSRSTNKIGTS